MMMMLLLIMKHGDDAFGGFGNFGGFGGCVDDGFSSMSLSFSATNHIPMTTVAVFRARGSCCFDPVVSKGSRGGYWTETTPCHAVASIHRLHHGRWWQCYRQRRVWYERRWQR